MKKRIKDGRGKFTPAEVRVGEDCEINGNLLEVENEGNTVVGYLDERGALVVFDREQMVRLLKAV